MSKTIVIKDQRYIKHVTQPGHPECPQRLEAIYAALQHEDIKGKYEEITPRKASIDEISLNHSREYIQEIERTAGRDFVGLDPDTTTSAGSWDAAALAVGGVLSGIDLILEGQADNGFALVRPPGHHAEASRAMGFCLFNNIAVGAHYLMQKHKLKRILIVDWDIHHGNGTQNAFYHMPEILYFSTHQFPYYPGSGSFEETGADQGRGFTVNVPLTGGQGDGDYMHIFNEILVPLADVYKPEFVLVSAGYDTYHLDPLGTMKVTANGFYAMTGLLKRLAEKHCNGRILLGLEGGYHIDGIAESVKASLLALAGEECSDGSTETQGPAGNLKTTIEKVKKVHSATWSVFK